LRISGSILVGLAMAALLAGCNSDKPPVDSLGKTPQQVVKETYTLILEGQYAQASSNFSAKFIQELITNNDRTFIDYCASTSGWRPDRLKAELVGKAYEANLWRVKLIPGDDQGHVDRAGVVHDLYMINGRWTIVFWGDYPKTYDVHHPAPRRGTDTASLPIL
jgi:hypothetical protein